MQIRTIDCEYVAPQVAAAFLLIHQGRAAFIDNNTAHAVPILLDTLDHHGLTPEDVDYCIITHVHLDHAGGSSALMSACPNAQLLAHPRAARHVIDPSRIIQSAQGVYGEAQFEALYGRIEPINADRVRTIDDEEVVSFAGIPLHFLHTRGHANHHMVIHIPSEGVIFTGDTFGIVYPQLQIPGPFAFPSTSPTDFDAKAAIQSVDRVLSSKAHTAYLTHFGATQELHSIAAQLKHLLQISGELVARGTASGFSEEELHSWIKQELKTAYQQALVAHRIPTTDNIWQLLQLDFILNAQGLVYAVIKQRRSS